MSSGVRLSRKSNHLVEAMDDQDSLVKEDHREESWETDTSSLCPSVLLLDPPPWSLSIRLPPTRRSLFLVLFTLDTASRIQYHLILIRSSLRQSWRAASLPATADWLLRRRSRCSSTATPHKEHGPQCLGRWACRRSSSLFGWKESVAIPTK